MAVGLDFLSKTKSSGMGSVATSGGATTQAAGSSSQSSSIFAQNSTGNSTNKADGQNMATMNTSDLMKYVYNNNGGNVDIQDKTGEKKDNDNKDNVQLPLTVEYGDEKFTSHGKDMDKLVDEISKKTGDSTTKVESELKRKYSTTKGAKQAGASLNMQA